MRISKYKKKFAQGYNTNLTEGVIVNKEVKRSKKLITKKLPDVFTKKIYKNKNKKDLRIEKEIKRNVNKLYPKRKGYDNSFNRWIGKYDIAI